MTATYAFDLAWQTPSTWAHDVTEDPLALLSDHAHCELQAAVACQALISRYPDRPRLVDAAVRVIEEEMGHFRLVVDLLREMGGELGDTQSNPYAEKLRRGLGGTSKGGLCDRLLLASMIERRSCERFEMLAQDARQPQLRQLYGQLAPEELLHQRLFLDLAEQECGVEVTRERLSFLVGLEGEIAASVDFSNRMHGGPLS